MIPQKRIRIAFIKFGGLSAGGTERWLQMMAANLPKDRFEVDYYYCDAAPYVGSDYKHANADPERLRYVLDHKVNLIKFKVGAKDITKPTHDWVDTDFWEKFDDKKYDIVQTGKAGHPEYPYYLINLPIVEYVTLNAGVDNGRNIACTIHLSEWQRTRWLWSGGRVEKSSIIPIPAEPPASLDNFRDILQIPSEALVAGFHQRADNHIFSPIPLQAFAKIQRPGWHFVIMGGGDLYRKQAEELKIENVHFLDHSGNQTDISKFLNTLDVFAHGRKDGETFGTVFAEAMMHGKPCLSHYSKDGANAQPETMGPSGLFARDLDGYTKKLSQLFTDSNLRQKLASKAKPYAVANYSLDGCVQKLVRIYEELFLHPQKFSMSRAVVLSGRSDIELLWVSALKYPQIASRFLKKCRRKLGRMRDKLKAIFQSSKSSFQGHHSEYSQADALERHRRTYGEFEKSDLFNHPHNKWADLLKRYPQIRGTAVDIGAGAGWLSARLSKEFERVVAVEPSSSAFGISQELYPKINFPNIEWKIGLAEQELKLLHLEGPACFVTSCVLSHIPDDAVKKICQQINRIAPKGSILGFSECWGGVSHEYMWHIRTQSWWQNQFPDWELDFHGPNTQDVPGRHMGFHGVRIKASVVEKKDGSKQLNKV